MLCKTEWYIFLLLGVPHGELIESFDISRSCSTWGLVFWLSLMIVHHVEGAWINVYPKKVVVTGGRFCAPPRPGAVLAMHRRPWTICLSSLSLVVTTASTLPPVQAWCMTGRSWAGATDASKLLTVIRTVPFPALPHYKFVVLRLRNPNLGHVFKNFWRKFFLLNSCTQNILFSLICFFLRIRCWKCSE